LRGWAGPRDAAAGLAWLQRAAAQGHAAAMRELGRALLVASSADAAAARVAAQWLREAAHHDDGEAMAMLGTLHARGEGVAADVRSAHIGISNGLGLGLVASWPSLVAEPASRCRPMPVCSAWKLGLGHCLGPFGRSPTVA
jgi:hypothetical protein